MSDKKWYIQDHSRNGTTVNGQPIPSNQDIKLKKVIKSYAQAYQFPTLMKKEKHLIIEK